MIKLTRIAPALLGLRQALKISIYDHLTKSNLINVERFSSTVTISMVKLKSQYVSIKDLKTHAIVKLNDQLPLISQTLNKLLQSFPMATVNFKSTIHISSAHKPQIALPGQQANCTHFIDTSYLIMFRCFYAYHSWSSLVGYVIVHVS